MNSEKTLKKLPIGIQSFSSIIEDGYVYADKTRYIYNLINNGMYYFLSRPRRFGKSLLVDTMKELFEGNRQLFKGLWIDKSDYDFRKYPVIRLDLTLIDVSSAKNLREGLREQLRNIAEEYGIASEGQTIVSLFVNLITSLKKKYNEKVVVLVDEYDKPVMDYINNPKKAEANRTVLSSLYGILKGQNAKLKFVFITGVTKYTKMSIFSKLNNLTDLTLNRNYAGICGITEAEFDDLFPGRIEEYRNVQKELEFIDGHKEISEIRSDILRWFDGYTWDGRTRVLNPFSLLSFFENNNYAYYWYASGLPTFLYKLFKEQPNVYSDIQETELLEIDLESHEIEDAPIKSLLFQTGFLTIKKTLDEHPVKYIVGFPNIEVSQSMAKQFIEAVTGIGSAVDNSFISQISKALTAANPAVIEECLTGLYASIPYQLHLPYEYYYQTVFLSAMQFLGFKVFSEVSVSRGRIDGTVDMINGNSYVIEFKYANIGEEATDTEIDRLLSEGVKDALHQIEERGYADMYAGSRRRVYKLAVSVAGRGHVRVQVRE